jgi:hypothetical protein
MKGKKPAAKVKPGRGATKKPAPRAAFKKSAAPTSPTSKRSSAPAAKKAAPVSKPASAVEKYSQTGAPWWKAYL